MKELSVMYTSVGGYGFTVCHRVPNVYKRLNKKIFIK